MNVTVQATKVGTDARVQAESEAIQQIALIRQGLTTQLQALDIQQQTEQQAHLNELTQGWRDWVRDVQGALGNFLFAWADGQINSIKDVPR